MSWHVGKTVAVVIFVLLYLVVATILVVPTRLEARSESDTNDPVVKAVAYLKGKRVPMKEEKLKQVVHAVYRESRRLDLDYRLTLAVISAESSFRQDAISNKGARGLMQIMPSLAKYIAEDAGVKYSGDHCLHQPEKNIKLGVYHLARLMEDFKSLPTALHAYNAGESRVRSRTSRKEPSTAYTKQIMEEYRKSIIVLPEARKPRAEVCPLPTAIAPVTLQQAPFPVGVPALAPHATFRASVAGHPKRSGRISDGWRGLTVLPFHHGLTHDGRLAVSRIPNRPGGEKVLTVLPSLMRPFPGRLEPSNQLQLEAVSADRNGARNGLPEKGVETGQRAILRA